MTVKVMGAEDFRPLYRPTADELVRRKRIRIAIAAYAYEIAGDPIMDDAEFDRLAHQIYTTRQITTGHPVLDEFFMFVFTPMTGMWVHDHPELERVAELYHNLKEWRQGHGYQ